MTTRPKVVFLGNHTVGVRSMNVIRRLAELKAVVAHPEDPEDGVVYESVYNTASSVGIPTIRSAGKNKELPAFIAEQEPDLIWITDYRYLLPSEILPLAKIGAINLHPSLLPTYRGRAPINWAILNGESSLGLTAHFVDEGMDTGDIITQESYQLAQHEDVGDALDKLYPLYEAITEKVLLNAQSSNIPRTPQDHTAATDYPRRKPEDGHIDWEQSANDIWNLIRAVAKPYPGAFSHSNDSLVKIWHAKQTLPAPETEVPPGTILKASDELHIACKDQVLVVDQFEVSDSSSPLTVGQTLCY